MRTLITLLLLLLAPALFAQEAQANHNALSFKALQAFEIKAEAKVNEFFNYLELLTDPKGNTDIKAHTATEATKLFENEAVTIPNIFDKKQAVAIKALLDKALTQKQQYHFKITGFEFVPQSESVKRKQWLLTYQLVVNNKTTLNISQEFYIVSEDKQFGKTTHTVWNTYLGAMVVK